MEEASANRSLEMCRRTVTTESLIEEAKTIFGERYDYSKVKYINREHMITVVCPKHGDFRVYARVHLDGKGCPTCEKGANFIQRLKDKFGDKFGLGELDYLNSTTPVTLICPEHGAFTRLPNSILNSPYGCPECGKMANMDANQKSHEEAMARKASIKQMKEDAENAKYSEWLESFHQAHNARWSTIANWDFSQERDALDLFADSLDDNDIDLFDEVTDPFSAYKEIVDDYIDLILRGNKREKALLGIEPLSESEAHKLPNYRSGDSYYLFPGQAAITNVKRYVAEHFNADEAALCRDLSHRHCHISFIGEDLLIREGRQVIFGEIRNIGDVLNDFSELKNTGLSVFVCAKSNVFYITDDISMEDARFNDDPRMWIPIPFNDKCSERVIKYAFEKHLSLLFRYEIFNTDTEQFIFNYIKEGETYSYSDVANDTLFAVSTIKTTIRTFERTKVVNFNRDGDTFTVLSKNVKQFDNATFEEDYCSIVREVLDLADSLLPSATTVTTRLCTKKSFNPASFLNLPKSFVSIDFEKYYAPAIYACSVGMVKYIDGKQVDSYYTLIRPPFEREYGGPALDWKHHITRGMLMNERTFNAILPEMEAFAEGLPLVAHNACVERDCIGLTAQFYNLGTSLPFNDIIDTYRLALDIESALNIEVPPGKGAHSLDTLCQRFGVNVLNHHHALDDAIMCGDLLLAMSSCIEGKYIVPTIETKTITELPKINPKDKQQRSDLENVAENIFKNKVIVLTGFAKTDSQLYAHQINVMGGIIKDSVNKKTDYLITGYNAGPAKKAKAQELGVQIISEEEFLSILKSYE